MKTKAFDKFIIFKENILFWQKIRLKMHVCGLEGLCAIFWIFRGQKKIILKSFSVKTFNLK